MRQTSQQDLSEFSNDVYKTRDIYTAAVIKQSGIPIIKIENNGRGQGIFIFRADARITSIISQYINGELRVDPRGLFENWKALKSMAFSSIGDVR